MTTRRRFTADFKAKVALEALRGDRTIQEIAAKHQVHPNQVSQWKRQAVLLESLRKLADGESVINVAIDLGYESPSAFTAMFRRTLGVTPGKYFK